MNEIISPSVPIRFYDEKEHKAVTELAREIMADIKKQLNEEE